MKNYLKILISVFVASFLLVGAVFAGYYIKDQSQEINDDSWFWGYGQDSSYQEVAQSFQPSQTADLSRITLKLGKDDEVSPEDAVILSVYSDDEGQPDLLLADSITIIDAEEIPDVEGMFCGNDGCQDFDFDFASGLTLSADTTYWIVLARTNPQNDGGYLFAASDSSEVDRYQRGKMIQLDEGVWADPDYEADFYFKTYTLVDSGSMVYFGPLIDSIKSDVLAVLPYIFGIIAVILGISIAFRLVRRWIRG